MNPGSVRQVRRNVRNVVHNYTDAQVKVREATSNDPWGPSSTLMSQIAEYSYNMVAFTDIMQMIWRRLNDHGKNWRHVFKALVLMDYLIKTGSERVAQQCKENIFAIETLKDFQHFEENVDQGRAIRERAKQLVTLLQDEEKLKQERQRALKARERFLESSQGLATSDGGGSPTNPGERPVDTSGRPAAPDLEMARPQTSGEEELQLQLAIAMSQEEADRERQRSRSDEVRLQMALKESEHDVPSKGAPAAGSGTAGVPQRAPSDRASAMTDLLTLDLGGAAPAPPPGVCADPWGLPAPAPAPAPHKPAQAPAAGVDPWGMPVQPVETKQADPWSSGQAPAPVVDPWSPLDKAADVPAAAPVPAVDPWTPLPTVTAAAADSPTGPADSQPWPAQTTPASDDDEFAELTQRRTASNGARGTTSSPWDMADIGATLTPSAANAPPAMPTPAPSKPTASRSPHSFLGENSALVNLDNLIGGPSGPPAPPPAQANPFGWTPSGTPTATNPFQAAAPPPPSINQIRDRRFEPAQQPPTNPWTETAGGAANPFLS